MSRALDALLASLVVSVASVWSAQPACAQADPGARIRVTAVAILEWAQAIAAVTAIVGATGAGIGALIGAGSKRDRWETVRLSPQVAR